MNLWSAWWHGENLRNAVVWGIPIFAWSRIGILTGLLAAAAMIADLVGIERLQVWGKQIGSKHDLKRSLLLGLYAIIWICFLPLLLLLGIRNTSSWAYQKWSARFGSIPIIDNLSTSMTAHKKVFKEALLGRMGAFFGESRKGVGKVSAFAFIVVALLVAIPLAIGVTWESWQQFPTTTFVSGFSHFMATLLAFLWVTLLGFIFPGSLIAGVTLLLVYLAGILFHLCFIKPLVWVLSRDTLNVVKKASIFTFVLSVFLALLAN